MRRGRRREIAAAFFFFLFVLMIFAAQALELRAGGESEGMMYSGGSYRLPVIGAFSSSGVSRGGRSSPCCQAMCVCVPLPHSLLLCSSSRSCLYLTLTHFTLPVRLSKFITKIPGTHDVMFCHTFLISYSSSCTHLTHPMLHPVSSRRLVASLLPLLLLVSFLGE